MYENEIVHTLVKI